MTGNDSYRTMRSYYKRGTRYPNLSEVQVTVENYKLVTKTVFAPGQVPTTRIAKQ